MSEAADRIEAAMQDSQAPASGWDMPGLRRMTGLTVGAFAAGVADLRARGRMHAFALELVQAKAAAPEAEPAPPSVAVQVAEEAQASVARRTVARTCGHGQYLAPTPGALLQEKALNDAPALAASIMKDRWGPVWDRVCSHARATNQRPIAAMISLLDSGLQRESHA
ncbi:hypothetical protein NYF14_10495 [Sphingobium sp. 10 DY56-G10]|uniref:hypothetical protein n=1 Tax=Sphingobium sp. 10 DY56-G10 TaxID=2974918 RepID=UPI00352B0AF0